MPTMHLEPRRRPCCGGVLHSHAPQSAISQQISRKDKAIARPIRIDQLMPSRKDWWFAAFTASIFAR